MKNNAYLLLLLIVQSFTFAQSSFTHIGQNNLHDDNKALSYFHLKTDGYTIPLDLGIFVVEDDLGNLYGYNQINPIPASWEITNIVGANITVAADFSEITYTGVVDQFTFGVEITDAATSKKVFDAPIALTFKMIDLFTFTIPKTYTNSCTGAFVIEVNEQTEYDHRPYDVEVYDDNNILVQSYQTNEYQIELEGLDEGDYKAVVKNTFDQSVNTTFTINEVFTPRPTLIFAGILCKDETSVQDKAHVVIRIDGGQAPINWILYRENGTIEAKYNRDKQNFSGGRYEVEELAVEIRELTVGETYRFVFEDANGCGDEMTFDVIDPEPLEVELLDQEDITCPGGSDGSLVFSVKGGWSEPWPGNIFNEVWSDSYEFDLRKDGVSVNINGKLTKSAIRDAMFNQTAWKATFENLEAGDYELTVIEKNVISFLQPNGSLFEREYTCEKDYEFPIELTDPEDFNLNSEVKTYGDYNILCANDNSGEISIAPVGGTETYTIQWFQGHFDDLDVPNVAQVGLNLLRTDNDVKATDKLTLDSLNAGNYAVLLTDNLGCTTAENFELIETEAQLEITDGADENLALACYGESDGVLSVEITQKSISDGTYIFKLEGTDYLGATISKRFDSTESIYVFNNLTAGSYTVSVEDEAGCVVSLGTKNIIQPDNALSVSTVRSDYNGYQVSCLSADDGTIEIDVTGGTTPYSISWTGPNGFTSSDEDLSNLIKGTYKLTITDKNGCEISKNIRIKAPNELTGTLQTTETNGYHIQCFGEATGKLSADISGGVSPYTYSWSTTDGSGIIDGNADQNNLSAGTYNLKVIDSNGCEWEANHTLVQTEQNLIVVKGSTDVDHIQCFGEATGLLSVQISQASITGGTYTYAISGNDYLGNAYNDEISQTSLSHQFENLLAGNYQISITDEAGCEKLLANQEISQPTSGLSFTSTLSDYNSYQVSCADGNDGEIAITPSGGTPPYAFSWSGPNGFSSTNEDLSNLSPGVYTLILSDAAGICSFSDSFELKAPENLSMNLKLNATNGYHITCFGASDGSIEVEVSGGLAPYTYDWSTSDGNGLVAGASVQNNLTAGTYSVTVTDQNNCSVVSQETLIQTEALLEIEAGLTNVIHVNCFGQSTGLLAVSISQTSITDADYVYQLTGTQYDGLSIDISKNTKDLSHEFENLKAGNYTIQVKDKAGCVKSLLNQEITQPHTGMSLTENIPTYNGYEIGCFNGNNGSIDIEVTGGTPPYSYNWTGPNGFNSADEDLSDLSAGTYQLTVVDATNSCALNKTYVLNAPDQIDLDYEISNYNGFQISYAGGSDGSIKVNVLNEDTSLAPYTFSWTTIDGSIKPSEQQTNSLTDLPEGNYKVTVRNANGCSISQTILIKEPLPLVIEENLSAHVDVLCFGGETGAFAVKIDQASVGPYHFTLYDENNIEIRTIPNTNDLEVLFDELGAGLYQVMIQDANGQQRFLNNIAVEEPDAPIEVQATMSHFSGPNGGFEISCQGAEDGKIEVTVTGGSPENVNGNKVYSYSWHQGNDEFGPVLKSGKAVSFDIDGLSAGFVTLKVQDQTGENCEFIETFKLTEPAPLQAMFTQVKQVQCFGQNDAALDVMVSGGTGVYRFEWFKNGTSFATTQNLSGLDVGTYELHITEDSNSNCLVKLSKEILQPDFLEIKQNQKFDVLCFGDASGSVDVSVIGGTTPYTYSWTQKEDLTFSKSTQDISGLKAGTYLLEVEDFNGCISSKEIVIASNTAIEIDVTKRDISCYNSDDGYIKLDVSGGKAPYSIAWSDLGNGFERDGLTPGLYDITVFDVENCSKNIQVEVIDAPVFEMTTKVTQISCHNANDGKIDVKLTGGIQPIRLTWFKDGQIENGTFGINRRNLTEGAYRFVIEDGTGCSLTHSFVIGNPQEMTLDASVTDVLDCNNSQSGAINLSVNGGTAPYTYDWNGSFFSEDIQNIGAGTYLVTVTDARGCSVTESYKVNGLRELNIDLDISIEPNCEGNYSLQQTKALVSGGMAPYNITWSGFGEVSDDQTTMQTEDSGLYVVQVTDFMGCTKSKSFQVDVSAFKTPDFTFESNYLNEYGVISVNDPVTFIPDVGNHVIAYEWNFGDSFSATERKPVHAFVKEGTYDVTLKVTYDAGFSCSTTKTISTNQVYGLRMPNAFSPNGDNINDTFAPVYYGMNQITLSIFDTWGNMIYFEKGLPVLGWDGTVKGKKMENGNYAYQIKAVTINGRIIEKRGTVILVR